MTETTKTKIYIDMNKIGLTKIQILCYILLFIAYGCKTRNSSQIPINIFNENDSCLELKNWHVVGPFSFSQQGNNLNVDNLKIFGHDENTITIDDFITISSNNVKNSETLSTIFKSITGANDKPVLAVNKVFSKKDVINANAYMGCIISSNREESVRLNFSSDNGAKVWLNNRLILNYDKEISVLAYENYIPIKLKKGDNFLLIKVYNSSGDWLMYSRIEKESNHGKARHQKIIKLINDRNFLKRSILDSLYYLEACDNLPFNNYMLLICDMNNKELLNDKVKIEKNWKRDISFLKEGLYKAKLLFNNDSLEELFYKGNVTGKIEKLLKIKINNIRENDLKANVLRLNHLLKPQNRGSNFAEQQSWQKKIVYLYRDISAIINNPDHSLVNVPGFHIRTYVSEIDNQPQYYITHVPKNFSKERSYPVVFLIPFKVTYNYHYLESMRVADFQLIENMQEIADKNNVIAVEPFFREVGVPTFNGIEETDFFEVLNAIKKDYKINSDQIYFVGSCEGAYKAFKLAVKYPDIPAALGFISPIYTESYGYSKKNPWVSQNEPMHYLTNMENIPITVIHSKLDGHVPIAVSEQFEKTYKASGLSKLELIKLDDVIDQYYWTQYSDNLIKSLLKYKKIDKPRKISLSAPQLKLSQAYWIKILQFSNSGVASINAEINDKNEVIISSDNVAAFSIQVDKLPYDRDKKLTIIENNKVLFIGKPLAKELRFGNNHDKHSLEKTGQIEGPFSDAFLHKFTIVIGKTGSSKENIKLKALGDSLLTMWRYKYWNDCYVKFDSEVTSNDINTSNLILLGNANSNLIIKKIIDKLPLLITKDGIELNNNKTKGDNLGFYMVYPNPLNKNKYAAIIGYNNPAHIDLGPVDLDEEDYKDLYISGWVRTKLEHMEFSCYGWFDYRVWDNSNNEIKEEGYFNQQWE
jgi:hypothetical protein